MWTELLIVLVRSSACVRVVVIVVCLGEARAAPITRDRWDAIEAFLHHQDYTTPICMAYVRGLEWRFLSVRFTDRFFRAFEAGRLPPHDLITPVMEWTGTGLRFYDSADRQFILETLDQCVQQQRVEGANTIELVAKFGPWLSKFDKKDGAIECNEVTYEARRQVHRCTIVQRSGPRASASCCIHLTVFFSVLHCVAFRFSLPIEQSLLSSQRSSRQNLRPNSSLRGTPCRWQENNSTSETTSPNASTEGTAHATVDSETRFQSTPSPQPHQLAEGRCSHDLLSSLC